jgi:acyl carrier protein
LLDDLDASDTGQDRADSAAVDETAAAVANIFAEILRVPRVGVDAPYFDLGGGSLQAVRLFATIKERFGVDLPLRTIFEAPTAAELAEIVRHRRTTERSVDDDNVLISLRSGDESSPKLTG